VPINLSEINHILHLVEKLSPKEKLKSLLSLKKHQIDITKKVALEINI